MRGFQSLLHRGKFALGMRSVGILSQAGWLASSKVVQGFASTIASLAIARHLGPSQFGQLSLAIAVASFVGTTASLGLEHIATRELATEQHRTGESAIRALWLLRLAGAAGGVLLLLAGAWFPATRNFGISALMVILCLLPLAQIGDVAEWQLVVSGRSSRIAIISLVVSPLAAAARIGMAVEDAPITSFAWALIAEWTVRSALMFISVGRLERRTRVRTKKWTNRATGLLKDSAPLLVAGIAVFIYMRIDQFMIAALLGSRQVGLYSAIVSLSEIPLALPVLILRAALPALARESDLDPRLRDNLLISLMRHAFYLHLGFALALMIFARPVIHVLYGETFGEATPAFRIQLLGGPFVALGVVSGAWIVLQNQTSYAVLRTLLGAGVNVILNFALIPRMGINGAALATLIAFIVTALLSDAAFPRARPLFELKMRALAWRKGSGP